MLILDVVEVLGKNSCKLKLQHEEVAVWELGLVDFYVDRISKASRGGQNGESGPPAARWWKDDIISGRTGSILT